MTWAKNSRVTTTKNLMVACWEALARPGDFAPLRSAARQHVRERYGIENGIARYMALLQGS